MRSAEAERTNQRERGGAVSGWLAGAQAALRQRDWVGAKESMLRVLAACPKHGEAHAILGSVYIRLGEYVNAREALEEAARLGIASSAVFRDLAVACANSGDNAGCEVALLKLLDLEPNEIEARRLLGELYVRSGRPGDAVAQYRLCLDARWTPDVALALARSLGAAGQWADCEAELERAVAKEPRHPVLAVELQQVKRACRGTAHLLIEGRMRDIQLLPGCRYASCALPVDYPPSRDLRPRWGGTRPRHQGLADMFAEGNERYRAIISEMRELRTQFQAIEPKFSRETVPEPGWIGAAMTPLDLGLLYYFIQLYRPKTFLEIGSGASTCFARRAVADHQLPTRIISIDPEPRAAIDRICDRVIRNGLETLEDLSVFSLLEPGDIVFMDGSHRTFMNSDVTVFMLDVMPLLRPGVIIHFHDIVLPYDYSDYFTNWYWNEQYILGVYLLAAKDRVQVLMPANYVGRDESLRSCLDPALVPGVGNPKEWQHGGSLWFTHR